VQLSQNWPGQPQQPQGTPQQQPAQPGNPYQQYPQGYPQQGYPQPYSPYQMPQVHPMAYAAQMQGWGGQYLRAGMMLIVTGILVGLCGLGCGALAMAPLEEAMANAQMDPQLAAMMTPQMMRVALIAFAVGSMIYAVLAVIFGVMVRKQSRGAAIGGIVITSIVVAYLLLNTVAGAVQVARLGAQGLVGVCMMIVPMVVGAWQLMWLIGALRSGGQVRGMQDQMQMQYWQMMAMQQAQQQQYQQMTQRQQLQQNSEVTGQKSEVRSQNSESEKKEGGEGPV